MGIIKYDKQLNLPHLFHVVVVCHDCGRINNGVIQVTREDVTIPLMMKCKGCNKQLSLSRIDLQARPTIH